MVRVLFLCLVLLGCHTARTSYEYGVIRIDDAWRANLDDDFEKYLNYWSELDSSRDGYYLVYSLALDAVVPDAFLFFYDKGDSITICPFNLGPPYCIKCEFKRDDFPEDELREAEPLYPNKGGLRKSIYGFKKEAGKKRYYRLIQMDACKGDVTCMGNWRQAIKENVEQYNINSRLFNRFAYLVELLFASEERMENARQTGKFSDEVFERFLREHQERLSRLEQEYNRLEQEYKELMDEQTDSLPNSY